jgi:hypothetical protein
LEPRLLDAHRPIEDRNMDPIAIPLARKGRPKSAVRIIMYPQAYAGLMELVRGGMPVETAGLLVGTLQEQGGYTWLWVRSVEPLSVGYEGLHLGFDPARVASVRDAIAAGSSPRPVGWFYSDPGLGVFAPRLNLREVHQAFGPGLPVMLVVNPSTEQGVFLAWRGEDFVPAGGYYEALPHEGAEPTIPWGGGLPANWRWLSESTGLVPGDGEDGVGFDLDTSPDTSGGDEWTDKFDTSPFSSAPYDLPADAVALVQNASSGAPPGPVTIDDLMAPARQEAHPEQAPPHMQQRAGDTGPLAATTPAPAPPASSVESGPALALPVQPPAPPPSAAPVEAPVVVQAQPPAQPVVQPAAAGAPVQPQAKGSPKASPGPEARYSSFEAAKSAQSAVMGPHQETRRLDDLRDYIRTIDPERPIDPEEEARWLGALRTGQLDDDALRAEIVRQRRSRRVPLSRRLVPLLLPLLLLVAAGAAVFFGWPALTGLVQEMNRPEPTPVPVVQPPLATPEQARAFTETGFTVSQPLLGFWRANGGLPIFGYPISERLTETSANGDTIEVQYFERARLEMHPEAQGRADYVRTGPIGLEAPKTGTPLQQLPEGLVGQQVLFGETNLSVPDKFYKFWVNSGAKLIFGPPVTGVLTETVAGTPLVVQYFERARFEYHPEAAGTPGEITLGLLGAEVYRQKHPDS